MGGLKKALPITYWTFLIGAIAIAGVPGLAGFFSKDEILWRTFASGHWILWTIGVLTSLLTATYMFRLVFLTFHGERRHAAAAPAHPEEEEPTAQAPAHAATAHHAAGTAPSHDAHAAHGHGAQATCTTRHRRWRLPSSCWRSDPCWPATWACPRLSAGTTGSSTTCTRASSPTVSAANIAKRTDRPRTRHQAAGASAGRAGPRVRPPGMTSALPPAGAGMPRRSPSSAP